MATLIDGAKILIADDAEILNNMLKDVFEENGFEVVQAFNGIECKSIFLQHKPDVAFVDVQMPKIDGIEVLRYIKERSPRTIVVMMTGGGSEETAVIAMKLGADEYLRKPFSTMEVVALATRLLESRHAGEETSKLHNKMRRNERHLAHLTTIINEALITTDPAGRIQFVNRAVSNLWGYSAEELQDKDVHFLIRGEGNTLLYRDLVKDTIHDGRIEGEFHFRRKDKGTFPGYLSTSVIKDNARVTGIVIVVADLTRLYEVERRLKQTEKLASLGKVVEGIAHEVRNCLTSLGGFALRLQRITSGDPLCGKYTGVMLNDVSRLEQMVKDIEDYVRFSKFYTYHFDKTELVPIIERARDKSAQNLSPETTAAVSFILKADDALPHIYADPVALEEVFYNLILNAYEAMPRGGRLKVTIKKLLSAVSVSVSDTGVGIRSEDLSDIFNPFVTSKTSGAGMGLCKVYLLVEEHRGIVNVTSQPNRGTTFEVLLPVERLLTGLFPWEVASPGGSFK
ncbi:MAG: response regulator [Desulfomonilaceae bacterium]